MSRTLLLFACASVWICCNNPESSPENADFPDSTNQPVSPTLSVTPTVTPTEAPDVSRKDGQGLPQTDTGKVRVMVSFISKGEGIDQQSKNKFDLWLAGRPNIQYNISPWGREGEVSYCFQLSNLSTDEQAAFVSDIRNLLTNRSLVYINEHIACEKRR
jgi:hypothetical protein